MNPKFSSTPTLRDGVRDVKAHEVFPGWSVVNDWDKALVEPWAERKARLARERAAKAEGRRA